MPGIEKTNSVETAGALALNKSASPSPASTPSAPVSIWAETTAATACNDIGGGNATGGSGDGPSVFS